MKPSKKQPVYNSVANVEPINKPYYNRGSIEVKDFIADQGLNFNLGNVVKYVCRAGYKDGNSKHSDLEKARDYIQFELDTVENEEYVSAVESHTIYAEDFEPIDYEETVDEYYISREY